jgi:hypothetical protein
MSKREDRKPSARFRCRSPYNDWFAQGLCQELVDASPIDVDHLEPPAGELESIPEMREATEPHQREARDSVVVSPPR